MLQKTRDWICTTICNATEAVERRLNSRIETLRDDSKKEIGFIHDAQDKQREMLYALAEAVGMEFERLPGTPPKVVVRKKAKAKTRCKRCKGNGCVHCLGD